MNPVLEMFAELKEKKPSELSKAEWEEFKRGTTRIKEIKLVGAAAGKLGEMTEQQFINALKRCGWKDVHHFQQQLRKDGPSRGILTGADLNSEIQRGVSEPANDGVKWIHRICGKRAYIIFLPEKRGLVTFSQK